LQEVHVYRFSFDGDIFPVMRHLDAKMLSQKAYALETKVGSETTLDAPRLDGCRPELPPPTEGVTQRVYTWEWVGALVPDTLFAFSLRLTVEPPPRQPLPETHQRWSFWQADIATLTARQERPGITEVAIVLDPAPSWWLSGDPVDHYGLMANSDLLIKTWWTLCINSWDAKAAPAGQGARMLPRVPSRTPEFRDWVETWKAIERPWRDRKYPGTGRAMRKAYQELSAWLKTNRPNLACSPETLADIIRAGEAGLLEHMPERPN